MSFHHHLPATSGNVRWGAFDADFPPVLTIASGDVVDIETLSGEPEDFPPDGFVHGVLPEHREVHRHAKPGPGPHLITGPIYVEGAAPGDTLAVEILDVRLRQDWAWNLIRPLYGTLPEDFQELRRMHMHVDLATREVVMPWGLRIPADPFFGIIGVAPPRAWGQVSSVEPRAFGGNMDNRNLTAGSTLYLPVFNPGALLSLGDGHAVQGHGEVCLTAAETALSGRIRVSVHKTTGRRQPGGETQTHFMTIGLDPDLDNAAKQAVREMVALIVERTGLSPEESYTLCSLVMDLHVTQTVDGNKGIHAMLPKWALQRG